MNKNISFRSAELLNKLFEKGKEFFTIKEAFELLPNSSKENVQKLLSDMSRRGLIKRLKEGLYCIIPYDKSPKDYLPNWHLVGEQLAAPHKYYIGFFSAFQIHGLITQPSLKEQIVSVKQFYQKIRIISNISFEFITLREKLFFGYEKFWINDYEKVYCSNIEKTILDSLYLPQKSNGIAEIVKAIVMAENKIDEKKLLKYLLKFEKQRVYKRLGFILDSLNLFPSLIDILKNKISASYVRLDSSLPPQGKHYSKWKILENADFNGILNSLET